MTILYIRYFSRSRGIKALHITLSSRIVSHKINDLEMISKMKWHLGEPKFAKIIWGSMPADHPKDSRFRSKKLDFPTQVLQKGLQCLYGP